MTVHPVMLLAASRSEAGFARIQQIASAQHACASIQTRARLAMTYTPGRFYQRAAPKATTLNRDHPSKATTPNQNLQSKATSFCFVVPPRNDKEKPQIKEIAAQVGSGFDEANLWNIRNPS